GRPRGVCSRGGAGREGGRVPRGGPDLGRRRVAGGGGRRIRHSIAHLPDRVERTVPEARLLEPLTPHLSRQSTADALNAYRDIVRAHTGGHVHMSTSEIPRSSEQDAVQGMYPRRRSARAAEVALRSISSPDIPATRQRSCDAQATRTNGRGGGRGAPGRNQNSQRSRTFRPT